MTKKTSKKKTSHKALGIRAEDHEELSALAKKQGLSMSELVHRMLSEPKEPPPPDPLKFPKPTEAKHEKPPDIPTGIPKPEEWLTLYFIDCGLNAGILSYGEEGPVLFYHLSDAQRAVTEGPYPNKSVSWVKISRAKSGSLDDRRWEDVSHLPLPDGAMTKKRFREGYAPRHAS